MFKKKQVYVNAQKSEKKNIIALSIALTLCSSLIWYNNFQMYQDLRQARDNAIIIYNQVNESGGDNGAKHQEDVTDKGAVSHVSPNVEEREKNSLSETREVEVSAYTSRISETDSSPCISADGTNICEYNGCVVASNDYDFGTKIKIDGFGVCEVKDRMNKRYTGTGNIDIYFGKNVEKALKFGRRTLKIVVIG